MHLKLGAAVGALVLAATATITAQPAYADGVRAAEWHLKYLKVSEAQAITEGAGVVVAVVDSGVYPHPDLKKNLLKGTDVVSGGDQIGQTDTFGHGTQMASLIAATGNGGNGVLGIAPKAKIFPVKSGTGENGDPGKIAEGITAAAQSNAKVINVSGGAGPSFELRDAITAAASSDAVVVAAAGNTDTSDSLNYPAAMSGVLAVGAIGKNGKVANFSVHGSNLGICAPGVEIEVAEPKSGYHVVDGTSPATAIVSGAAALVRAKFPQLSAQDVIHRLEATADDNGPAGKDDQCGYGVLNIVKALTADVPPLSGGSSSASGSPSVGGSTTSPVIAPSTTSVAEPSTPSSSNSGSGWVVGGVIAVVVVAGLAGIWGLRRRSS